MISFDKQISEEEFNITYEKYARSLGKIAYGYLHNKEEAEDIIQIVFIKLLTSHKTFDDENHLKYWLIRVTTNASIDYLRKNRKSIIANDVALSAIDPSADKKYDEYLIKKAVDNLPIKYRTIIICYYYNNLSIDDISCALGVSSRTVYRNLNKAKEILKKELEVNINEW